MEQKERFAANMRAERARKGASQKVAAKSIGVTQGMLSAYERGESVPSLGIASRIADYYGITLDQLAGR